MKDWARLVKRDIHAIYLCSRDPRVPWHAKALAILVAAYALSPIDLIPDFVPVLGYLDDVILVPVGIWLVVRLIPPHVMAEQRELAAAAHDQPVSRTAGAVIVVVWIASAILCGWLILNHLDQRSIVSNDRWSMPSPEDHSFAHKIADLVAGERYRFSPHPPDLRYLIQSFA